MVVVQALALQKDMVDKIQEIVCNFNRFFIEYLKLSEGQKTTLFSDIINFLIIIMPISYIIRGLIVDFYGANVRRKSFKLKTKLQSL